MIALVIFGLLAIASTGDSLTWTTPVSSTADVDVGAEYFNEGSTVIYTLVAVPTATKTLVNYKIASEPVTEIFELATPSTGAITLKSGKFLDGAFPTLTYVLKITAIDDGPTTGTATYTVIILPAQFKYGFMCIYVGQAVASSATVEINPLSSTGTNTLTIASGNTNTDFAVSAAGVVTTVNALTTASGTSGGYNLVITGADDVGTNSTVTTTMSICIRGSACTCTLSTYSGAADITAGLLGMFAAAIMMLLNYIQHCVLK